MNLIFKLRNRTSNAIPLDIASFFHDEKTETLLLKITTWAKILRILWIVIHLFKHDELWLL